MKGEGGSRRSCDAGVDRAEDASRRVKAVFVEHAGWRTSDAVLRELRKALTFAIYAVMEDLDQVAGIVDRLFSLLEKPQPGV